MLWNCYLYGGAGPCQSCPYGKTDMFTTAVAELQVSCMGSLEQPEHLDNDLSLLLDSVLSLQAPTVMHGSILQDVKEILLQFSVS